MGETGEGAVADGARRLPARHVAAVCVGNALEFYDFVTYAFFAAQIGRCFFPSQARDVILLASLATFGAGFLTRPLGAWVIGRMGDRRGRKPAMLLSFALIGIASIGLPLTPSYASIGALAPILVIGFRLLQGFALGGEVGPSTAFMMEAAPLHRRGLYISLQSMSADAATLAAGAIGVVLAHLLNESQLDAWGWRVALLAGAVIVPFGLYLRRTLGETLHVAAEAPEAGSGRRIGRQQRFEIALAFPYRHGVGLHDFIGILAFHARLYQRQQHGLRKDKPAGGIKVFQHAVLVHDQPVDHAGQPVYGEIGQYRGIGRRHAFNRRVRDIAFMPQHHILKRWRKIAAQKARKAGQVFRQNRVFLVRHCR